MKIIGIELRIKHAGQHGYEQKEIACVPCDIDVEVDPTGPGGWHGSTMMNMTLHTDGGDIAVNDFPVPVPTRRPSSIRARHNL